ncbi:MAG: serine hydrolase [Acidobacteria bacterium]|nr:serine hydrolase [Acidobacteriota bacterium]
MKAARFVLMVAGVLLVAGGTAIAQSQTPSLEKLDGYIEKAMRNWEVPGIALSIVKSDAVVLAKGYGIRELGKPGRVDANTIFSIASVTKAFTAASVGILVDAGKVKWDEPVVKYMPGFALYDLHVTQEFTVRDLLSHRSGLERGDWLWSGTDYDRDGVVAHLRFLRPIASLRAAYGYSNNMYIAAGQMVAAVSGMSWDDFVKSRIFGPLGMSRSGTTVRTLGGMENVATPHEPIEGVMKPVPHGNLDNEAPGGSITSTVSDMARWIRLQLGDGVFEGKRLISAAALEETRTPQTIIPVNLADPDNEPGKHFSAYCFGWQAFDYRGRRLLTHDGSWDGIRSSIALVPEERFGFMILTNRGRGNTLTGALRNHVLDFMLGASDRDWSAEYLRRARIAEERAAANMKTLEASRVTGTIPSLPLAAYAGTYSEEGFGVAEVRLKGTKLYARLGPRREGELEHWHYNTFRATWQDPLRGRTLITFSLDSAGKVDAMDVQGVRVYKRTGTSSP